MTIEEAIEYAREHILSDTEITIVISPHEVIVTGNDMTNGLRVEYDDFDGSYVERIKFATNHCTT